MAAKRERSAYNRAYRESHRDHIREIGCLYRQRNKERIRAYLNAWHIAHPEKAAEYRNKPGAKQKIREQIHRRYRENPEVRRRAKENAERQRQRIKQNPELHARTLAQQLKYRNTEKGIATQRRKHLRREHGLDLVVYERLLASQGGLCAICRRPEKWQGRYRTAALTVDHDHLTDRIRGLLCRTCNRGLGLLGDTADTIRRTLDYLYAPLPPQNIPENGDAVTTDPN